MPTLAACLLLQDKVTVPDRDYSTQRVILGTHTSENEQNHLIIAGATCGGRQYAGGGVWGKTAPAAVVESRRCNAQP